MPNTSPGKDVSFTDLGLSARVLTRLNQLKFTTPTPIQYKAIPIAVKGGDVIGIAQTGTGKTLAFALPLIEQISRTKKAALVILPTRELALQVNEAFAAVGQPLGLRCAVLIGGASMQQQIQSISRKPHVYIGTPGRLLDHLDNKTLKLQQIGILVLDEADRMLDMGFAPQITSILKYVPSDRQTMLFSATMPPTIIKMAATYMKTPVRVEVAPTGTVAERVKQELFIIKQNQKNRLLDKLLADYQQRVLIFARTKYGAKRICRDIRQMGHTVAEIHSNLSQSQRQRSLDGFRSGKFRVMVATDIASRGIDVTNIELVINYDLPDNLDDYVHRVGRTGRAGKVGDAISFVTPDQRSKIRIIERIVRDKLPLSPLPQLPDERPKIAFNVPSRGHYNKSSRRGQGRGSRRSFNSQNHPKRVRTHF